FGTGQNPEINSAILREQNISFVINTGDLVLMGGGPDFWWKRYFMENSYMRSLITLPTKGNHEVFGIESDFNNTEYEKNHAFPNHENWYAVNYSNVHFICLEFTNYRAGAVGDNRSEIMKLWLRHDLSQINTTNKFDFIVVYMHYPLQTLLGGNGVNMDTWEKYAGSEFRMAHVVPDIVFTGHVHDYERSLFDLGDYNGDGHDDYCWNIVSGGGGAELAPARWTSLEPNYFCVELVHHYCTVDVNGKSLVLNAKTATGAVFDHLEINKS
ncbi:MAG: metallophosphoesterase family protein, partial [Promethearchaeota archaeon]